MANIYRAKKNYNLETEKRFNILVVFIILVFALLIVKLLIETIGNKDYHAEVVETLKETIVSGESTPRGRIYDRNHNLLVDNKALKLIYYKKPKNVSVKDEKKLAYEIIKHLNLPYDSLPKTNLKEFWMILHPNKTKKLITDDEYKKYEERKLTDKDIYNYKIERITDEDLNTLTEDDKKAAYVYYLMNKGYYYDEKIIKNEDVTDDEYAFFSENSKEFPGFGTKLDWVREYKYGNVFKTILGNVSSERQGIPEELSEYYLSKGYSLNDRVGISYLELQYESILKGKKNKYKVLANNELELVEEGSRGSDIVLSIDINLQRDLENILEEELRTSKTESNTQFFNRSFVVVSNPLTGEIYAMAGKQILWDPTIGNYKVYDYTPGVINSSVTVGSVVKGASMTVGYNTKAVDIGTKLKDECVKLAATPLKCSWKTMGYIDDKEALRQSSNVYQYKIAMKVAGYEYRYNMGFKANKDAFDIYRNTYAEYGLGIKTGIDLPGEVTGFKGTSNVSGLLLDFAIGQYDNYTPIQLSQYINAIANKGYRIQPQLLKEVYNPSEDGSLNSLSYQTSPKVLNKVRIENKYLERIRDGLRASVNGGVASGHINTWFDPAGKTGTAESFVDSNNDGKIDTETVTRTFAGWAPYDNPKMSIVAVSPDTSTADAKAYTRINQRLSQKISSKYFEYYP